MQSTRSLLISLRSLAIIPDDPISCAERSEIAMLTILVHSALVHHPWYKSRHRFGIRVVEVSSLQNMFAALLRTPQVYNLVLLDHLGAYF